MHRARCKTHIFVSPNVRQLTAKSTFADVDTPSYTIDEESYLSLHLSNYYLWEESVVLYGMTLN